MLELQYEFRVSELQYEFRVPKLLLVYPPKDYPSFFILPQNKHFVTAECMSMILFIHVTVKVCLNIRHSELEQQCEYK